MLNWLRNILGGSRQKQARHGGLPLWLDPGAKASSDELPAFLAPPPDAPPYHGFAVIEDVTVEGWTLGLISNAFAERSDWGDAFVIAPDGRRAGIVWQIEGAPCFERYIGDEGRRFGVFGVCVEHPPYSVDEGRAFLREILPEVRHEWETTRAVR